MSLCRMCEEKEELKDGMCADCIKESVSSMDKLNELEESGHTSHCAARQVWGDGECECKKDAR